MTRPYTRSLGATLAATLGGLAACADDLPTTGPSPAAIRPSAHHAAATVVAARPTWVPPSELDAALGKSVYLLPKACDVFIGDEADAEVPTPPPDPEPEPVDPNAPPEGDVPEKYDFQVNVVVPKDATVKLVTPGWWAASPYAKSHPLPPTVMHDVYANDRFVCDPELYRPGEDGAWMGTGHRVVDPITDHAAKGDGPKIFTTGVVLELDGHGLTVKLGSETLTPTHTQVVNPDGTTAPGEPYDNMGVVLLGSRIALTNNSARIARFDGFGHALELEGDNLRIVGKQLSGDLMSGTAAFNIESKGGVGARLSTGNVLITGVKSVDNATTELDPATGLAVPVGVAFELRRCAPSSITTVTGNHFEANGEAAIIRECGAGGPEADKWGGSVEFEANYLSSGSGVGLSVSQSGTVADVEIGENTFHMKGTGSHAIEWTNGTNGLTIVENVVRGLGAGACPVFNTGDGTSGLTDPIALARANFFYGRNAEGDGDNAAPMTSLPANCGFPPGNPPPTVGFTDSCVQLACTFSSTSSDADGIASQTWTFENGATATGATASRTYPAGGTYAVTLRVVDGLGASNTLTRNVTVSSNRPPVSSFSAECTDLTCSFTSTSADPDGSIQSSTWSFGDGATASGATATRLYAAAGVYNVTLTVTDNGGATRTSTQSVTVTAPNAPPTASFTVACNNTLTCTFTSASTDGDGSIASSAWSFGDGTTGSGATATHTYATGGNYTTRLTVTDNRGATATTTRTAAAVDPTAANRPPTVSASASCTGLSCTLQGLASDADGTIASRSWSFGDGSTGTGATATKTYRAAGVYTATFTATDDRGGSASATTQVSAFSLSSARGSTSRTGARSVELRWSGGAAGTEVDIVRNGGESVTRTENDGSHIDIGLPTTIRSFSYQVCVAGSRTMCSASRTVTF